MRFVCDHNGAGELRTLHLVNRSGVRQLNIAGRLSADLYLHRTAIEIDGQCPIAFGPEYDADRAVHHAEIVVVPRLDHLVAWVEPMPVPGFCFRHIEVKELLLEQLLEFHVELDGADWTAMCRRQHLNVPDQVVAKSLVK